MSAQDGVIRLPSLGADMESAELVEWKIAPGATIHRGDVIALIETDKGLLDLEAFEEGRIAALLCRRLPSTLYLRSVCGLGGLQLGDQTPAILQQHPCCVCTIRVNISTIIRSHDITENNHNHNYSHNHNHNYSHTGGVHHVYHVHRVYHVHHGHQGGHSADPRARDHADANRV